MKTSRTKRLLSHAEIHLLLRNNINSHCIRIIFEERTILHSLLQNPFNSVKYGPGLTAIASADWTSRHNQTYSLRRLWRVTPPPVLNMPASQLQFGNAAIVGPETKSAELQVSNCPKARLFR
jgi:hypothetical protein